MQFALPLFLLSWVVLQQTMNVQSLEAPILGDNKEGIRSIVGRRSLLSVSSTDDRNADSNSNESNSHSDSDDEQFVILNKRRYNAPLFGRQWIPLKRRGPLFG